MTITTALNTSELSGGGVVSKLYKYAKRKHQTLKRNDAIECLGGTMLTLSTDPCGQGFDNENACCQAQRVTAGGFDGRALARRDQQRLQLCADGRRVFFEKKPGLASKIQNRRGCIGCFGQNTQRGSLRLTSDGQEYRVLQHASN